MELKNIYFRIDDNKINTMIYTFEVEQQEEKQATKKTTIDKISEIETIIENSYGEDNFEKKPTNNLSPHEISAGFRYTELKKENTMPYQEITSTLTYEISTHLNKAPTIKLMTQGLNQELQLKIYDSVKSTPQLKINKDAQTNIEQLDFIRDEGYKNTKYPGLVE